MVRESGTPSRSRWFDGAVGDYMRSNRADWLEPIDQSDTELRHSSAPDRGAA